MTSGRKSRLPRLSSRLSCILGLVPASDTVFDIGCDHALVSIALALDNRCRQVFAVDKRVGPLAVATDRIRRYGVQSRVMPILADGLDQMMPGRQDTVVIAGMGGNEIIRILERRSIVPDEASYVLQPMKSAAELRMWMSGHAFTIEEEQLCRDGRHIYCVIRARVQTGLAATVDLSREEIQAGPCVLRDRPPLFQPYIDSLTARLRKAARTDPGLADVISNLKALCEGGT
jgi:tRNA (adenine22-N1)-methyltransferase